MKIDGTIINADVVDIISVLKAQLAIKGVFLFEKYFDSGDDVMVCCPYHKQGQERRPSAGIRKSDGLFHCLACGETHSLPEVISNCYGHTDPLFGYKWLMQNFANVEVQEREAIKVNFSRNNISNKSGILGNRSADKHICVSEEELDKYRYIHPYLYERGLTDEVIEQFDLGYDKATDSITFPVRDKNGDCMFVARRAVKTKRFDIPKGITKPLYGLYELSNMVFAGYRGGARNRVEIYVCEGLFDCLRLWCNGKIAVAGFGCLFNSYQVKQLQDLPFRTIVLALDADEAGKDAAQRLRKLLTNKIIKEVVLPDGRKDIGECSDAELQNLKEIL